jgi:hypothetical protein
MRVAACPERSRGALRQGCVVERSIRVSRRRLSTLHEMLCNQEAAHRFWLGMAREPQEPPAVLKRHHDFAPSAQHVGDFTPGDADVDRPSEFEPAACQNQMAVLVGTAPAESHRRHEMAFVPWRQRVRRLDLREVATAKAGGEFCSGGIVRKRCSVHVKPSVTGNRPTVSVLGSFE